LLKVILILLFIFEKVIFKCQGWNKWP